MTALPRLLVAGTRSGVGKTTVACGLMAALRRAGHRVSGHKVGPDFIDPGYHALATGRPPRNLDAFMHGPERIARLLAHGAAGADIAVIEGVMGLFDGRSGTDEASSAHIARLTRTPVVLVVDAASASRSVAAEIHGFATFDPDSNVDAVILNRVGSDRHERMLRDAIEPLGIPVVGVLRRKPTLATPSRHLGLVPAAERAAEARRTVDELAEHVTEGLDLEALWRLARSAAPVDASRWEAAFEVPSVRDDAPVVAVAGGAAFTFSYTEHQELLEAAGAQVVGFDPLTDGELPERTGAIYLGGGFPEVHGSELAANTALAEQIRAHSRRGAPIVAECGGLLYLCRSLDGLPMVGLIDAEARFTDRLTLGYRSATMAASGFLGTRGTEVRGHEFHRTTVTPASSAAPAWTMEPDRHEGFAGGGVHASYLHPSWVGTPELASRLVAAA